MENFNRARAESLANVFSEDMSASILDVGPRDLFTKLEKLLTQVTRIWWDHNTLIKYVDKRMIPRGLRMHKRLTTLYSTMFQEEVPMGLRAL